VDPFLYLYTIAAVGMSFAGLSALTMILRQILGGQLTKFDSFVARSWIQLGFIVTLGAILPPLFALLEASTPMVWRVASGVMAIILGCWALTFPQRRLATKSTRLPIPVIVFLAAKVLIALAFAANAVAAPVALLPGVYAASVSATLIGAAMLFLFTFVHWYDAQL
jgi:hypothetical protein